jgi:hypothetical protein
MVDAVGVSAAMWYASSVSSTAMMRYPGKFIKFGTGVGIPSSIRLPPDFDIREIHHKFPFHRTITVAADPSQTPFLRIAVCPVKPEAIHHGSRIPEKSSTRRINAWVVSLTKEEF